MDVTATGQASAPQPAAVAQPVTVTGTVTPTPNVQAASASAPVQSGSRGTPNAPGPQPPASERGGLAPAIAKLFGGASPPLPIRLDVSYRVLSDPSQIVTVFSDPTTGAEVAQFPPDILINIAQFFDQQSGVTLDRDV